MLLAREKSQLLVIDLQERLVPALADGERVIRSARILLEAAERLGVPALLTEQYPKGLGPTVPGVAEKAGAARRFEKQAFSCASEPKVYEALARGRTAGRATVVIVGAEAHICVLQSALALGGRGFEVAVVCDGVSSRAPGSVDVALTRMARAGVQPVTTEMVVFEWLGSSADPQFKTLSALIR